MATVVLLLASVTAVFSGATFIEQQVSGQILASLIARTRRSSVTAACRALTNSLDPLGGTPQNRTTIVGQPPHSVKEGRRHARENRFANGQSQTSCRRQPTGPETSRIPKPGARPTNPISGQRQAVEVSAQLPPASHVSDRLWTAASCQAGCDPGTGEPVHDAMLHASAGPSPTVRDLASVKSPCSKCVGNVEHLSGESGCRLQVCVGISRKFRGNFADDLSKEIRSER